MVTHNPDVAAGASRVVHLRDGVLTAHHPAPFASR
jgi:hypothetical protein